MPSDGQTNVESPEVLIAVREHIARPELAPARVDSGVDLSVLVSKACGATGMSTGIARFAPGARLAWHLHHFSEAITVLEGTALVTVNERQHRLSPYESLHVPAETPHLVVNASADAPLVAHSAFATEEPNRVLLKDGEAKAQRDGAGRHEHVIRPSSEQIYELAPGAYFHDAFARRYGAEGICGGYGRFLPGASLPCHTHDFDESITIVQGEATCLVEGRMYELSAYDTAFVPRGRAHRFINTSQQDMAMVWVYAGAEPDRKIVDTERCSEQRPEQLVQVQA